MRFATFLSQLESTADARDEIAREVRNSGIAPDVAFVFFSAHHAESVNDLSKIVPSLLLGCSAEGVIGAGMEVEREPGVALLVAEIPGVRLHPIRIARDDWRGLLSEPQTLLSRIGYESDTRAIIGFGDPFTTPLSQFLSALDGLAPSSPLIGGMASSARAPGENALVLGGDIFNEGFVGVSLSGAIDVETIVSQGCKPIGHPLVITRSRDNVIEQLGGKPALTALQEIVEELPAEQREMLQNGLMVGRAITEYRDRFGRGDFLVRNIVGVDQESGAIALADFVRTGQTVQFHVRDAQTADEDLNLMLEVQKVDDPPAGALLFSCNGRGTRLFDAPSHDIAAAGRAMPATPVAGFFAAGEIGPIGGKNFIHGHTASFALFRPKTA